MDKKSITNIIILSLIFGIITGALLPIPYIGLIALYITLLLSAPIVLILLIMAGDFDISSTKDSIVYGALIGFCANLSASFVYSIITAIATLAFNYSSNFIMTTMIVNSPIWLLITFFIFVGVLCATTNSFTGFATYYIINLIRDIYEKQHPNNTLPKGEDND